MSSGAAQSKLSTQDTVLRGALSYKFRIELEVNKEVNGNSSEQVSDAQVAS